MFLSDKQRTDLIGELDAIFRAKQGLSARWKQEIKHHLVMGQQYENLYVVQDYCDLFVRQMSLCFDSEQDRETTAEQIAGLMAKYKIKIERLEAEEQLQQTQSELQQMKSKVGELVREVAVLKGQVKQQQKLLTQFTRVGGSLWQSRQKAGSAVVTKPVIRQQQPALHAPLHRANTI